MELRIGGHKTVHADYVSYICQILVLHNVGPYAWDSRNTYEDCACCKYNQLVLFLL